MTGCTSDCGDAMTLDSRPLRKRVAGLVENPKLELSPEQRGAILSMSEGIPETDIIIVSASSSNHYDEMQAMFHGLHTVVYPVMAEQRRNFSVVLFDLGLTRDERRMVRYTEKHPSSFVPKHLTCNKMWKSGRNSFRRVNVK